jgi:hypothetical protein
MHFTGSGSSSLSRIRLIWLCCKKLYNFRQCYSGGTTNSVLNPPLGEGRTCLPPWTRGKTVPSARTPTAPVMESAWQCRKRTVDDSIASATSLGSKKPRPELSFQEQLEECYALRCLCGLPPADLHAYLNKFAQSEDITAVDHEEQLLLGASCLAWIGESCHQQLVAGRICPALQAVVASILSDDAPVFFRLLPLIKVPVQFPYRCKLLLIDCKEYGISPHFFLRWLSTNK